VGVLGEKVGADDRAGRAARAWSLAAVVMAAIACCGLLLFAAEMAGYFDPPGTLPLGLDFDAYWSAARIAQHAAPASAYVNSVIEAVERAHTHLPSAGYLAFYYPPSFLLLCLPLALLPYVWALLAFVAAQAALLWPLARRILVREGGGRLGWLPVLAYPGFLMNVFSGQNGGFSASCLAGAMLLLEDRPFLGGACLGALACKPQLAAMAPLALLAARRWRALAGAACTALALAAASWLVLGSGAWAGFLQNAPAARADIETLPIKWPFMQSFYGGIRLAGGGIALGYAGQLLVAALAVTVLLTIGWRRRGAGPEMAALSVTALLVTPFLYDYDLVLLAAPLAWLAGRAMRTGFLPWEKPLLVTLYLLPFAARAAGLQLGLTLAPPLLIGLLLAIRRRANARP
jgi:alpha-1,2-mannosyltransferase